MTLNLRNRHTSADSFRALIEAEDPDIVLLTELRTFPQSIMEASLKAANELYAELSDKNADFKKTYDSMVAFRGESLPWWQFNEYAYDTFMIRTRGRA